MKGLKLQMEQNGSLTPAVATFQWTGQRQRRENQECEDVILIRETKCLRIYGVADGQSGKNHCRVGARESLEAVAEYIENHGVRAFSGIRFGDEVQFELIQRIRERLLHRAEAYRAEVGAFSSTLIVFALDSRTGEHVIIHLGDGCVLGVEEERGVHLLSAPENGITAQYTWLTTSDKALSHLRFRYGGSTEYARIALMTDGADCLCRGKNLSFGGRKLLDEGTTEEITCFVMDAKPSDDTSIVILDFKSED